MNGAHSRRAAMLILRHNSQLSVKIENKEHVCCAAARATVFELDATGHSSDEARRPLTDLSVGRFFT
jgi:hypothetical protein